MEMTWLETVDLLGLDLLAGMILALLALDLIDQALHSAWHATRAAFGAGRASVRAQRPSAAMQWATDSFEKSV